MDDGLEKTAKWDLLIEHSEPLLRLERLLRSRRGFTLVLLAYDDDAYRDRVIALLDALIGSTVRVDLCSFGGNFAALEERLEGFGQSSAAIHLVELEIWQGGLTQLLRTFNYRREWLAQHSPVTFLVWLKNDSLRQLALEAPDLWAWRSGVLDFCRVSFRDPSAPLGRGVLRDGHPSRSGQISTSAPAFSLRRQVMRSGQIGDFLDARGGAKHAAELHLLVERGELKMSEDPEGALKDFLEAETGFEKLGDKQSAQSIRRRIGALKKEGARRPILDSIELGRRFLQQGKEQAARAILLRALAEARVRQPSTVPSILELLEEPHPYSGGEM